MLRNVTVTVTVDTDAWNAEYGTADSAREIVEQVRAQAEDGLRTGTFGHLAHVVKVG